MNKRITIMIANKDRPTEVGLLLTSLLNQTYKNFDILILDDGSGTPLHSYYFIQYLVNRLKLNGHNTKILRNNVAGGVSNARQKLVDEAMKWNKNKLFARIDDDSICEVDFLEKLLEGINRGYDLVGCIVPHIAVPDTNRDIKFVKDLIGYCEIDNEGQIVYMGDDCGFSYSESKIIPTAHFRSSCLYKRELHEKGVDYKSRLSKNGFLEEAIFSFKAILKGFKLAIHTGAINWHLATPSGGERDTMNMTQFNSNIFQKTVKKMFDDKGNFLEDYYKKLKINTKKIKENLNYNYEYNLFRGIKK